MVDRTAESARIYRTFGQLLTTLCPYMMILVRMQEKLDEQRRHNVLSVVFNKTCIKEGLLLITYICMYVHEREREKEILNDKMKTHRYFALRPLKGFLRSNKGVADASNEILQTPVTILYREKSNNNLDF